MDWKISDGLIEVIPGSQILKNIQKIALSTAHTSKMCAILVIF